MADRVIVFVDYQNMHGWARRQFLPYGAHPAAGHIRPLAPSANCSPVGADGPPSSPRSASTAASPPPTTRPGPPTANDRQTATWERSDKVEVIRRPLRYPPDWPGTPATEPRPTARGGDRPGACCGCVWMSWPAWAGPSLPRRAGFTVGDAFLVGTTTYVVVPALMIAASLMLAANLTRIANIVLATVYALTCVGSAIGERACYLVGTAVEVALLVGVAITAWRWPKAASSPR